MRHVVEQRVASSLGNVVSFGDRPTLIDRDLRFRVQPMADPANTDLPYPFDPCHLGEHRL